MKWNTNGIKFLRGDYEALIAHFDGLGPWFSLRGMATQQTQKSAFKRLGEVVGAKQCEVKLEYDDDGNEVEGDVVVFMQSYNGDWCFYREEPHGLVPICRYTPEEVTA